jgi:hypothetical protein
MTRFVCVAMTAAVAVSQAAACTFCAGGLLGRATLRERQAQAAFVVVGTLSNPRFDPAAGAGRTDFAAGRVLKADSAPPFPARLTVPQYLPVIGDTPADYLLFCTQAADGSPEVLHGQPATADLVQYLAQLIKLDAKTATDRLRFFAGPLGSADPAVAGDAFLEFAKASDAELVAAKAVLPVGTVRKLLHDPATPIERVAVLALLLGLCGDKSDAAALAAELDRKPLDGRVRENAGGYLAALTSLDPEAGWRRVQTLLADAGTPFDQRLAAVGMVRFFQASKPADTRPRAIACYRPLVGQGDFADVAIDDLRRWGWWELTADILAAFDRPSHAAPVVRRGIVRYALLCPAAEAKAFVARVRASDAKLVAGVEESLRLYDAK